MSEEQTKYEVTAISGRKPTIFEYLRAKSETEYPTDDVKVYAEAIAKMNLGDLQTHAMDKGIKPSPDRRKLESNLINQFKAIMSKRKANRQSRKVSQQDVENAERQRQKSIERAGFLRTRV
jgi:hypothetical protein